jgi:hypothetical protein
MIFSLSQQVKIWSVQFNIYNINFSAHFVGPWALLPDADVPFAPTPSQEIPSLYYAHESPSPHSRKKIGNAVHKNVKECLKLSINSQTQLGK